jgi:predicted transglutaminase-like cysteine proteinase
MGLSTHRRGSAALALLLGVSLVLGWGCAASLRPTSFQYFHTPDLNDAWSPKIQAWQRREIADRPPEIGAPAAVADGGSADAVAAGHESLRGKYGAFLAERKRALARDVAEWIQQQSRQHYVADGPVDHWATLEETLRTNGDDCDGLELLTYHFLRDLGFPADEVFRSIVFRRSDGQHHMVTLWFEDRDDPWVIDPTGAMTAGMPRMSELPEWAPIKVFSEEREYSVRETEMVRAARR